MTDVKPPTWTRAELLALPPTLDPVQAGRLLGIGRSNSYKLIQEQKFPVPVLRLGETIRVPTTPLLRLLGIDPDPGLTPTPAPGYNFVPPAWEGEQKAVLDSATAGAAMLDTFALTPYGRNFLAHALVQLGRDGWLNPRAGTHRYDTEGDSQATDDQGVTEGGDR